MSPFPFLPRVLTDTPLGRRLTMTAVTLLPLLAVLALGLHKDLTQGPKPDPGCWLLPNARLIETPTHLGCPLESEDRIRRVETASGLSAVHSAEDLRAALTEGQRSARVEVERAGVRVWIDLPVHPHTLSTRMIEFATALLASALLLSIPLLLLWRSTSTAAMPLLILYSAIATLITTLMTAQGSDAANRIAMLTLIFIPASVAHLAMHFPRRRPILQTVPGLEALPYGISLLLVPVGWFAMEFNPILWPPFLYLIIVVLAGAWMILIVSCVYELHDARSAIALARGRVMLFGAALAPLVLSLAFWPAIDDVGQWAAIYVWCLPVALPLPIGLAISRYNLFDLGVDLRASVSRFLRLSLSALILAGVLGVALSLADAPINPRNVWLLFLAAITGAVLLHVVRGWAEHLIENALESQFQTIGRVRGELAEKLSTPQSEESTLRVVADSLLEGLGPHSGSFFICSDERWRLAHFSGANPATDAGLAQRAHALLGEDTPLVHLAMLETPNAFEAKLLQQGIEVISAIGDPGQQVGVLLVGREKSVRPYTRVQLDFIAETCAQVSWALKSLRLLDELIAAEEQAATGRVALGVAHELGKELSWMKRLAQKLPSRISDPVKLLRDTDLLVELSEEASESLRGFVEETTRSRPAHTVSHSLLEMVERNARRIGQEHGEDRVSVVVEPSARPLVCHPHLGRVLFNLLDNALHASAPSEQVRLFATVEDNGSLRIEVLDAGPGIPASLRERVFEPGFTSRRGRGGSGVGLTVAREITENLGGTLSLSHASPRGTCACLHLPAHCLSTNTQESHAETSKTKAEDPMEKQKDIRSQQDSRARKDATRSTLTSASLGGSRS
ncbi:MAG: ATP-binding protein [Myxococcota bacterium]